MSDDFPILDDNERSPAWDKHSYVATPKEIPIHRTPAGVSSKREADDFNSKHKGASDSVEIVQRDKSRPSSSVRSKSLKRVLVAFLVILLFVSLGGRIPGKMGQIVREAQRETREWVFKYI